MITYYPQLRVLNMAEIATQNIHNLPMRGALVRDALSWSKYIGGALQRYGNRSDVMIAQPLWPVRGTDRVQETRKHQRHTYKFVHDQTVRLKRRARHTRRILAAADHGPSRDPGWQDRCDRPAGKAQ